MQFGVQQALIAIKNTQKLRKINFPEFFLNTKRSLIAKLPVRTRKAEYLKPD